MPLAAGCSNEDKARLKGRIGIFVQDEKDGNGDPTGDFKPAGCCVISATPPPLTRESSVDETCIGIDDCDNPTTSISDPPPNTSPGSQNESEFTFNTNYVPGGDIATFYETAQKSGEKFPWMLCYINGAKQMIDCAWVKSVEPQEFDADTTSMQVQVTLSICSEWSWT